MSKSKVLMAVIAIAVLGGCSTQTPISVEQKDTFSVQAVKVSTPVNIGKPPRVALIPATKSLPNRLTWNAIPGIKLYRISTGYPWFKPSIYGYTSAPGLQVSPGKTYFVQACTNQKVCLPYSNVVTVSR